MPFWQKKYRFTSQKGVKKIIIKVDKCLLGLFCLSFNQQLAYICGRCQTILQATERESAKSAGSGESHCPFL